jgi:hypothetical protein
VISVIAELVLFLQEDPLLPLFKIQLAAQPGLSLICS